MDRTLIYANSSVDDRDQLRAQRFAVEGLGALGRAVLGAGTTVEGLTVSPPAVPGLSVVVSPGALYGVLALDAAAYGDLPPDARTTLQQALSRDPVALAITPPSGAGQSITYLVQAAVAVVDRDPDILPYFNAANPDVALSGPGNSGTPQNTTRAVPVTINLKPGAAAPSGSQATPTPDPGFVALATVTVPNGATAVAAANIQDAFPRRVLTPLPDLIGRLLGPARLLAAGTYVPSARTRLVFVEVLGGGGGGGAASPTGTGQVAAGSGGGAGGYACGWLTSLTGHVVTVGAGGGNSASGGTTSFGSALSATGGTGGTVGLPQSNTTVAFVGQAAGGVGAGGPALGGFNSQGGMGKSAFYGPSPASGEGGASICGGGSPLSFSTSAGLAAVSPGAGGSGGVLTGPSGSPAIGGAGSNGFVRIWEYA